MADLWEVARSNPYLSAGILLALGAVLVACWGAAEALWRLILAAACALGMITLIHLGRHSAQWPFAAPRVALAAIGTAIGLWGLVHGPLNRLSKALHALAVALGLGAFLLVPASSAPGAQRWGTLFGLAEIAYVLAAAALWHGVISAGASRERPEATIRPAFGAALLLLTAALLLYGLGAQWAWGAYWSWEPLACWWLAAWLVVALAASLAEHLGWASRWATLSLWIAACFSLGVLLGSLPLVQGLGLNGQY